jgi:hypothetical protein
MNFDDPEGLKKRLQNAGLKAAIADELAKIHGEDYKKLMETVARKDELANLRDDLREVRSDMRAFEARLDKSISALGEAVERQIATQKTELAAEMKTGMAEAKLYTEQQMKGQTRLLAGVLGLIIFAATVVDKIPLGGS